MSDSEHWRSIFDTDFKWTKAEKEVARSLAALRTFKVIQPTPGILSLIRSYRDGIIKFRLLRDAVSMIEIFHFLFNAVTSSRSSGGISGMYSSFGRQIFESTDPQAAAKSIAGLRKKLRERKPSDSKFDADFEEVIFTKNVSSQKALVQYILKKVSLEECQTTVGDTDDLTIEHFLPEAKQKDGVPESIIGQIGNLFLVDSETNSQLASKDFVTKKDILLRRGYKLPQAFLEAEEITDDLIRANTLRVANLARTKVWKL